MVFTIDSTRTPHPFSALAKEFPSVKIIDRDVYVQINGKDTFCENVTFFEKEFIRKNGLTFDHQKTFADVINEVIQSYCYNSHTECGGTNGKIPSPLKANKTYSAKRHNVYEGERALPNPYFPHAKQSILPIGTHGEKNKLIVRQNSPDSVDLIAPIPSFGMKLSSGTYYFNPTELKLTLNSDGTHIQGVKPKVNQTNYEHFFVYNSGEVCYGDIVRWKKFPLAFTNEHISTPKLGFTYAQVLNEAKHVLHLGYVNDLILPVRKPDTLTHLQTPISGAKVYNNL